MFCFVKTSTLFKISVYFQENCLAPAISILAGIWNISLHGLLKGFVIQSQITLCDCAPYRSLPWVLKVDLSACYEGSEQWNMHFTYGPHQVNLVLIAYASSEGSGEPAHPRSLARTFAARSYKQLRGTFKQKARSLAPLNGWACAVKICHDGMLEDTNSLDGAHVCRKGFILCKCFELYEQAAKVLARLRGCACSPEPSLLA